MDERFGAGRLCGFRHMTCALVLDRVESLLAGREQDADEIDDRVCPLRGGKKRVGIAHIGLDGVDLPDPAKRLEMAGKLRTPDRHPHARAGLGDGADHVAADEARAAIDRHERPVVESDGHVLASPR